MLAPAPLADEFATGHLGRIAFFNGFPRGQQCEIALRREHHRRCPQSSADPLVNCVAGLIGMDTLQYVRLHTMLPFHAFVLNPAQMTDEGEWGNSVLRRQGLISPRAAAYLCAQCAEEDLHFWGPSYWRRAHQLPGVNWCDRHATPLCYVAEKDAFLRSPMHWVNSSAARPVPHAEPPIPQVQRFIDVCTSMLDAGRVWDGRDVGRKLMDRAMDLGIRVSNGGTRPLLSEFAVAAYPLPWLQEVFPVAKFHGDGRRTHSIDSVLRCSTSTAEAVALASALMFDTVEEVFLRFAARRTRSSKISMYAVCRTHGGEINAIAKELGVTTKQAAARLTRNRDRLLASLRGTSSLRAACMFLDDGLTLADAARSGGVTTQALESVLRLLFGGRHGRHTSEKLRRAATTTPAPRGKLVRDGTHSPRSVASRIP